MYQPTAALVCELLVFSICCSPVDAIDSHVTGEIILPWFLSPLFSCLIAAALVFYLMKTHGVGDDEKEDESQLQWRKKRMATTTLSSDDEDEDCVFDDEADHYDMTPDRDHDNDGSDNSEKRFQNTDFAHPDWSRLEMIT